MYSNILEVMHLIKQKLFNIFLSIICIIKNIGSHVINFIYVKRTHGQNKTKVATPKIEINTCNQHIITATFIIPKDAQIEMQKLESSSPGLASDLEAHFVERIITINQYLMRLKQIGEADPTEIQMLQNSWQNIIDSSKRGADSFCKALAIYLKHLFISFDKDREQFSETPNYDSKNILFNKINNRIFQHIENIKVQNKNSLSMS